MPATKAQQKAQNKWISKAYDRINLTVEKGKREVIRAHAAEWDGGSVNAFINRAIDETMERDKAFEAPARPVERAEGCGGICEKPLIAAQRARESKATRNEGGEVVTEVMTDKQFKTILEMVNMILDGCKNLDEAKEKVAKLIEDQSGKKDD